MWRRLLHCSPIIAGSAFLIQKCKSKEKITVVMDLDNTLIHAQKIDHSVNTANMRKPHFAISFDDSDSYRVWLRPFATIILAFLARTTNLHLFTAADRDYTDAILRQTKWEKYFQTVTTYDDVDMPPKDLTLITLSPHTILVDDKSYNNTSGQLFYHIPQYKCYMRTDVELLKLIPVILMMYLQQDSKTD